MTSRRRLLSAVGVGVAAGVSGCAGVLQTGCASGYNAGLTAVTDRDVADDAYREPPIEERSYDDYVLGRLVESPDETLATLGDHRLDEATFVRVADTYYRVTRAERTTSGLRATYEVRLSGDDATVSPDRTYGELPRADREALLATFLERMVTVDQSDATRRYLDSTTPREVTLEYPSPEPTPSQFAADSRVILAVNGVAVVFDPVEQSVGEVETAVLGLEPVGTTPEEASAAVLDRMGTALEGVSERDAEFLRAATEDDQTVCESDPDPDQPTLSGDLRETLHENDYVRYRGQWYDVDYAEYQA